jgi:DNA modification methylase
MSQRRRTATSNFGVGARESHDASAFYARFRPPELSADDAVLPPQPVAAPFVHGDARHMDAVADGSVALVVTSPPYFAGKQYEEELAREGVPSSYLEYLATLTEVFAECVRKLEPGGRIAVNVANLGRKPYRSLSADVIRILEDELGLLLRGELIWQKAEGANGSCAWGSFRSAANPVLRDITERVVVASKGRFDRARSAKRRAAEGLPHESTLLTDDFLASTLDVWSIPPESARRVGHPAPFPVELPEQLIHLYTFRDDLVLDPFMGSGSALVAAARLGRRYVGYDLDAGYVEIARQRVAEVPAGLGADPVAAVDDGRSAVTVAEEAITGAGFRITGRKRRFGGTGVTVDIVAVDGAGAPWFFLVGGPHTSRRGGLRRPDEVWKALGRAAVLRRRHPASPVVLLTTCLPAACSDGDLALRAAVPTVCLDVIDLMGVDDRARLAAHAAGGRTVPGPGTGG